jgi:hypothetical protein
VNEVVIDVSDLLAKSPATDFRSWEAWQTVHQPFELRWWERALATGHSDDPGFTEQWREVRNWIDPHRKSAFGFDWTKVIDIGCGPRPPFRPCVAIEPLGREYRLMAPSEWWEGVMLLARPAEDRVQGLRGDTIICWNCLDHTIGWREILDNMLYYGNPGALFAIATDFHEPFVGHPGYPKDEFLAEIDKRFITVDRREPFGRELALLLRAR